MHSVIVRSSNAPMWRQPSGCPATAKPSGLGTAII